MRPHAHCPVQWPRVTCVGTKDGLGRHGAVSARLALGPMTPARCLHTITNRVLLPDGLTPAPAQSQEQQEACRSP